MAPLPPEKGKRPVSGKKLQVLFLALRIFSATGGIEKVCRIAGKALDELGEELHYNLTVFSSHDENSYPHNIYFSDKYFKGFDGGKLSFIAASVMKGIKCSVVILSHVNLVPVGYLIKKLSPKTKLVLIAHGIEVWRPLQGWKRFMLTAMDVVLPVSLFTKEKIKTVQRLKEEKLTVLNNSLDPFLPPVPSGTATAALRGKYGFSGKNFIMLTLTRLSATEKNKGYDKILFAMAELLKQYPQLRYLFVGKYDEGEKKRLDDLIAVYGLTELVVFTGFVPDAYLAAYYSIADVYVMPSEKEGFGISFIEALYYGVPVIAGNRDGTTDALLNGKLGTLIDPRSQADITSAMKRIIENKRAFVSDRELIIKNFSYPVYKRKLQAILEKVIN